MLKLDSKNTIIQILIFTIYICKYLLYIPKSNVSVHLRLHTHNRGTRKCLGEANKISKLWDDFIKFILNFF